WGGTPVARRAGLALGPPPGVDRPPCIVALVSCWGLPILLGRLFQPFVEKRPVCVMARGILERVLDPQRIDRLFADTAQRQYTRDLLFSSLVDLLSQVVFGWQPSV